MSQVEIGNISLVPIFNEKVTMILHFVNPIKRVTNLSTNNILEFKNQFFEFGKFVSTSRIQPSLKISI